MTLLHTLWTPTWVTPMARQLSQLNDDTVANTDVHVVVDLADGTQVAFDNIGLEVVSSDQGIHRASATVRLPTQAIDVLSRSPVVRVSWHLFDIEHVASLSHRQGQRYYQLPIACLADGLPTLD